MGRGFVGFIGCLFSAPGQASGPEPAPKKYWLRERYCDPHQLTPVCLLTGEGGDCVAGSPRSTAGTSHGPLLVRMGHVPSLSRGASSLQSGCPLSYSLRSLRALNDSDGLMETKSSLLLAAGRWRPTPHPRRGHAGPHFQPQASTCAPEGGGILPGDSGALLPLTIPGVPSRAAWGGRGTALCTCCAQSLRSSF